MFRYSQIAIITLLIVLKFEIGFFINFNLLSFRYLVYHFNTFERLGIPGPKPTFFLGNLLEIRNKVYTKTDNYTSIKWNTGIYRINKRYKRISLTYRILDNWYSSYQKKNRPRVHVDIVAFNNELPNRINTIVIVIPLQGQLQAIIDWRKEYGRIFG